MDAMSFDTRKAFRDLRAGGADESLADAIVDLVRQASDLPDIGQLATKDDVTLCKAELRADIAEFKAALEAKIGGLEFKSGGLDVKMAGLENRMDARFNKLENRVLLWIAASTAVSAFANGGFQFLAKVLRLG